MDIWTPIQLTIALSTIPSYQMHYLIQLPLQSISFLEANYI
jgi:hypothetical protein